MIQETVVKILSYDFLIEDDLYKITMTFDLIKEKPSNIYFKFKDFTLTEVDTNYVVYSSKDEQEVFKQFKDLIGVDIPILNELSDAITLITNKAEKDDSIILNLNLS